MPPGLDVNQNRKIYLNSLSRIIAYSEKRYEYLGLKYFALPIPVREMTHPMIQECMAQEFLNQDFAFCPVRRNIRVARRTREKAQRCVFANGAVTDAANDWLKKLDADIAEMREGLRNLELGIRTHPRLPEYRVPVTEDIDPTRYWELRAWIITIPATVAALQLGICNEEQAFEQVINNEIEDCFIVPLPSIEPESNFISSDINPPVPHNSPHSRRTSEAASSLLDLYYSPQELPTNNIPSPRVSEGGQAPVDLADDPHGFDGHVDVATANQALLRMVDTNLPDQTQLNNDLTRASYMSWEFNDHPNPEDIGLPVQPFEGEDNADDGFDADNVSEAETLVVDADDRIYSTPMVEEPIEDAHWANAAVEEGIGEYPYQMPLPGAWEFR